MVTLVGPGTTVITARVGETEEHAAASASYNLHVVTKAGADSLSVVLKDNSEPITFTNDEDNPWTIEDGYIQNGNVKKNNSSSCLTGTFTIGKTSMFVFDKYVHRIDNSTSSNLYHHTGKPTNTVSYCAMFSTSAAMAGRQAGSFISTVERLFLSIQFRSAVV